MEIERKFPLKSLPDNLESYPSHHIEQVYLNYNPVVRARKQDDEYYLTYKGSGMMARDESNLPLNEASYYHLREFKEVPLRKGRNEIEVRASDSKKQLIDRCTWILQ